MCSLKMSEKQSLIFENKKTDKQMVVYQEDLLQPNPEPAGGKNENFGVC